MKTRAFLACILLSLALAVLASPESTPVQIAPDTPNRDGLALAACLEGKRISMGEGVYFTCHIHKQTKG